VHTPVRIVAVGLTIRVRTPVRPEISTAVCTVVHNRTHIVVVDPDIQRVAFGQKACRDI
jgi:hypothetical protein